jgi:hypothetical protein
MNIFLNAFMIKKQNNYILLLNNNKLMSLDDFLRALDKLDDASDKERFIRSVIQNPTHPHHSAIPSGIMRSRHELPSLEDIDSYQADQNIVWNEISKRFDNPPELLDDLQFHYQCNLDRLREMTRTPDEVRKNMPLSNLPEYRGKELHNMVKRAIPLWESNPVLVDSISPERLGNGAYADVHLLTQTNGTKSVLKLFRPEYMIPISERALRSERIESIKHNLMANRKFFSEHPSFANLQSIPYDFTFYVGDYAEGTPLKNLFASRYESDRTAMGLLALSSTLEEVHSRDMVFIDVKPDSVLVDYNGTVKICDYDFCMTEDMANENPNLYRTIKTPIYVPMETLDTAMPISSTADLEQLAYIIDHAFNNSPFIMPDNLLQFTEYAQLNRRVYPKGRQENIPQPLRDVVTAMLTYPRDESVSAKDFTASLKEHYNF